MKCPFCGFQDTKVLDSRPTEDGSAIRRRRSCLNCNERFTTYERIEEQPLIVIKKDLTREPFSRTKLLNGMIQSCPKRPVSLEQLDRACSDIEKKLSDRNKREVPSSLIGELVMEQLKDIDQIAYVRFASVYRDFKDVSLFYDELEQLENSGKSSSRDDQ